MTAKRFESRRSLFGARPAPSAKTRAAAPRSPLAVCPALARALSLCSGSTQMGDEKDSWKVKTLDEILQEKKRRKEQEEKAEIKRLKNVSHVF